LLWVIVMQPAEADSSAAAVGESVMLGVSFLRPDAGVDSPQNTAAPTSGGLSVRRWFGMG
jgi:hypothetical protein